MPLPEINFDSIRAHDGSRNAGFEELCCQLASLEPRAATAQFYRKGRGGDAGVECFVRSTDGKETGWQAKYVFAWSPALAAQLDSSIETALAKHPKLTTYIVCLPFDLPDARAGHGKTPLQHWETWRDKWIKATKSKKRKLKIDLWSKSGLTQRLALDDPPHAGRLAYWFDQDAFTQTWFEHQFGKARAALGSRYTPETNVELPIRRDFLGFTRDHSLNLFARDSSIKTQDETHSACRAVRDVGKKSSACEKSLTVLLKAFATSFSVIPIGPDRAFPVAAWSERATQLQLAVRDALKWIYEQPATKDSQPMGGRPKDTAQHYLFQISDTLSELIDDLNSERWKLANHHALLLTGAAGTGKSHLLADVVEHHIASGFPGVLVLGSAFVDGEPWRQLLGQLDLPATLQTKHFLGAMDAAGQAAGVRAVICIDAINERNGLDVWPSRLASFLQEIKPFPHVAVVLSCRSTYVPYVIPDGISDDDLHRIDHTGFSGRASDAAKVYLDKRGIVRPGAPNLVPEFENPLFLKTCCDYLEKEGKRELPKGLTGVTQIFGFYVEAVARALNQRMRLDPHANVVTRAIGALAEAIVENERGYIDKTDAISLLEGIHLSNNRLENSLLSQLESEGAIAIETLQREDGTRSDEVRFTFERFSDFQIAKVLLERHLTPHNAAGSFAIGTPLYEVVAGEDAYRRSGIIEALSVQLPERGGMELIDLVQHEQARWGLRDPFLESLHWRDQRYFTDRTLAILKSTEHSDRLSEILFSVVTEPNNKFNAHYLHARLLSLALPERDSSWTIFVNRHGEDENGSVITLISWAITNGMEHIEDNRAELAAIALAWLLTASNRAVRDKATKALACLLANRLALAAKLVEQFVPVDDPYVSERLLAACYGATLQGMTLAGAGELARAVYKNIFLDDAPTANALLRDHAYGILQYLAWRNELPHGIDMAKAKPPYRSAWPLEYVSDELIETYKQTYGKDSFGDSIVSSTVSDGDFARYQIDHLVHHWTQAPLGAVSPPTYWEIGRAWIDAFCGSANAEQMTAVNQVLDAARALKGAYHGYQETPETLALKESETAFRQTLQADQWEEYRVKARAFVRHTLFAEEGRKFDSAALFDSAWGRRWICKRAHEYGWTPVRFAEIERNQRGHDGRMEHRIERIGKKYQWCAMYDLGARLADHLAMKNDTWRGAEQTQPYEGAWQVGLRNMDPSLLVEKTHYEGWGESPRTWWVPFAPALHEIPRIERLIWRDTSQDIINDSSLIDVRDPKTGRRWLALDGFSHWYQHGIEHGSSELQRGTWFRLNCVVARQSDRTKLLKWLRSERLTGPDDLPEIGLHSDQYLGEYPWHPSLADIDGWHEPGEWRKTPVPIRATVATYAQERAGYDYSIDKTINVSLPAPWLMRTLGLRLSNGRKLTFVSPDGRIQFFDPSVSEPGPHAALIDRDAFLDALKQENLCAFWVIAGEKDVYAGTRSTLGWGGRLAHSYVYELKNNKFVCYKKIEIEKPSAEQLKAYLGGDGVKVRTTKAAAVRSKRKQAKTKGT